MNSITSPYSNKVKPNCVFFSFPGPAINPLHQPSELVISEPLPKHQNISSLIWVWWDKDLANEPFKDMSMERVRVRAEEFRESKVRLWMSQFWFSLEFFSQKFFWKLSTFHGYKGIYSRIREEYEKSFFFYKTKAFWRLSLVSEMSREITARPDYTFCSVVLQLSWPFSFLHASHVWHFVELLVTSHSRDLVARNLLNAHTL